MSICLHQVEAGQTRSWPTLSLWWSWTPPWSPPRRPARCAPLTWPTRSCGATSSPPWSLCRRPGSTSQTLPFSTKWPRPRLCPSSKRPAVTRATEAGPYPRPRTQRRSDWSRVSGTKARRTGGSETLRSVFVLATCEADIANPFFGTNGFTDWNDGMEKAQKRDRKVQLFDNDWVKLLSD